MKNLRLLPKEDRRLLRGHLWAYRNEFAELPPLDDGEIVDVFSVQGRFVGRGFYQAQGGIAVRVLARSQAEIDAGFWAERIAGAWAFRAKVFPGEHAYRWVFGESDGLPGLVADRYGGVVSAETSCGFYAAHADQLAQVFQSYEGVEGVRIGVCGAVHRYGAVPASVECVIEGVRAAVDVESGQKTGLFLDQRANWPCVRRYASGGRVLDGHCYVGLWSIHAALGGAQAVVAVDTAAAAIEGARANAQLNGVEDRCTFVRGDIMEVLQGGEQHDVVVLDPPAFAKSRAQEHKALALYQALNTAGMKAVRPGGVLITSCCSHFVGADAFGEALKRAATSAQRQAWILEMRGAAPDHPVLMSMPETAYLKCAVLRVL